ncbi:MAG TPA: primosomal protein N' [Myxococcota bacterium]|nr:primosomal protein N' [Myxococcota bacterium]
MDLFARASSGVVRVALPVPEDRLFDYAVPSEWADRAEPGRRALVPLGGRRTTGVIVECAASPSPEARGKLRPLEQIVDPEPVISADLLEILRAEARALLCPLGIALATALPAGSAPRPVELVEATERGRRAFESGAAPADLARVLSALADGPLARPTLLRRVPGCADALPSLEREGFVRRAPGLRGPAAREATAATARVADGVDIEAACAGPLARAPKQAALLRRLAERGECDTSELAGPFTNAPQLLRELARRGLVARGRRRAPRAVLGDHVEADRDVALTDDQQAALAAIGDALAAGQHERFLLHGVTGSGKTEVYLRAVADALARGRQALILVPEITLTHQIVARLRGRFGDGMAVLHSGLSASERLEQWQRLRRGEVPIAVGARSGVFAPLERLGLVILDEEHDGAYKNEEGFRYHARTLATRRAALARCPIVLGSATPSLETRHAAETGEWRRLALPRRIGGRPLPAVEIVDLAAERAAAPRGRKLILSARLRRALRTTLDEGGQTILFLNRRGFSTKVLCFECGHAEHCKHCDIALVYHAGDRCLRCHYCGFEIEPPDACTGCGAPDTALLGVGTERLEEEVRAEFPAARLARLDRDVAARKGATREILRDLREGRLDVLIGTQMVAKGHDYPGVRLVGVVAADLALHMPDFRASERTFQLLTQVAGRAGRGSAPGRVVLQTFVPDHYAIAPVRTHDYERFYRTELASRAALGYPPFGHLAYALVSGPEDEPARASAEALATAAREAVAEAGRNAEPEILGPAREAAPGAEILGPAPAPLARLRGRFRHQILAKGADAVAVRAAALALARAAAALRSPLAAHVDLHPINML